MEKLEETLICGLGLGLTSIPVTALKVIMIKLNVLVRICYRQI